MGRKTVLLDIIIKELESNQKYMIECEKELALLPKGSIVRRKIGSQEYFYLSKRVGQKVVTEYIGKSKETDIVELEQQIVKRRELEKELRELKKDRKEIERMLK